MLKRPYPPNNYKIEEGREIPESAGQLLKKMKVGDSFEAPMIDRHRIQATVSLYHRGKGMRWTIRQNIRVWRVR
jgi:hypothetical protein